MYILWFWSKYMSTPIGLYCNKKMCKVFKNPYDVVLTYVCPCLLFVFLYSMQSSNDNMQSDGGSVYLSTLPYTVIFMIFGWFITYTQRPVHVSEKYIINSSHFVTPFVKSSWMWQTTHIKNQIITDIVILVCGIVT